MSSTVVPDHSVLAVALLASAQLRTTPYGSRFGSICKRVEVEMRYYAWSSRHVNITREYRTLIICIDVALPLSTDPGTLCKNLTPACTSLALARKKPYQCCASLTGYAPSTAAGVPWPTPQHSIAVAALRLLIQVSGFILSYTSSLFIQRASASRAPANGLLSYQVCNPAIPWPMISFMPIDGKDLSLEVATA